MHLHPPQNGAAVQWLLASHLSDCPHLYWEPQVTMVFPLLNSFINSNKFLSFLNWLTIAPSIWYFDDKFLSFAFSKSTLDEVGKKNGPTEKEIDDGWSDGYYQQIRSLTKNVNIRNIVNLSVGCLIAYLSVPIITNLASPSQAMNRSFDPFRIVNTYGAFGRWDLYLNTRTGHIKGHHLYTFSVTKERTEVVIEGSDYSDLENPKWLEYEFKCKPGSVTRAPCLISPYHYRLVSGQCLHLA